MNNSNMDHQAYEQCQFCDLIQCPNRTTSTGCPALVFEHGKPVLLEGEKA